MARGLAVHVARGRAVVSGPIDEIDAHRILDIVSTEFSDWIRHATIETTLDASQSMRYRTEELGPSGYNSPPIRPAPEIPIGWVLAVFFAGILVLALLIYHGGILSWEEFGEIVRDAARGASVPVSE